MSLAIIGRETYNQDQVNEMIEEAKQKLISEIEEKFTTICCDGCDCEYTDSSNVPTMKHCWRWTLFKEKILG
jgi:hypothetical protein